MTDTDTSQYSVPQEPRRWLAILLAVIFHAALFAFLWFGINWHSEEPTLTEVDVFSPQTQEAAPPAPAFVPPPPTAHPAPPVKEQPPVKAEETVPDPDIALEKEKKRKAEEKKQHDEARKEKEKQEAQQAKEDAEKAEEDTRVAAAEKKKREEEKHKQEAQEKHKIDAQREEEKRRLTAQMIPDSNSSNSSNGRGTAALSQGIQGDSGYGRLIKSHISFPVPSNLNSNPAVEFTVDLLPDGSIASIRQIKSSGLPAFDEAVKQAINASQPFPADKSGKIPHSFTSTNHPKDQ